MERTADPADPRAGSALADRLGREFTDQIPHTVVRAVLIQAISDLRGSISLDALPEMAVRLARVRLAVTQ